jgi:hypothetical protein
MNKQAQEYPLKLLNRGIFDRSLELDLNFGSDSPRDSLFQFMALLVHICNKFYWLSLLL